MQKHACIRAKKKSWQTSFSRIRHKKGRLYESLKTEKNLLLLNFASGVQRKFIHSFYLKRTKLFENQSNCLI